MFWELIMLASLDAELLVFAIKESVSLLVVRPVLI